MRISSCRVVWLLFLHARRKWVTWPFTGLPCITSKRSHESCTRIFRYLKQQVSSLHSLLAMCGIAVRLYLISAVGWHHPAARRKFTLLFPVLLVLDGIWAASPLLLLWNEIRYGPALIGVALLAYDPFRAANDWYAPSIHVADSTAIYTMRLTED